MECTQYAGDVMFAPESYGHATLNAKASIGFAMEFFLSESNIPLSVPPLGHDYRRQRVVGQWGDLAQQAMARAGSERAVGARGNREHGMVQGNAHHQPYLSFSRGGAGARRR